MLRHGERQVMALALLFLLVGSPADAAINSATMTTTNSNGLPLVSDYIQRTTPGNVAVCFSGGGSRAMTAAMGQMRALKHLGLLKQVKTISSVSGGSWATVPYTFLPSHIDDDDLLGGVVTDLSTLSLTSFGTSDTAAQLDFMSSNLLTRAVTHDSFSLGAMAIEAAAAAVKGVADHQLWNYLIGEHILKPFGLASWTTDYLPEAFFCPDQATCLQMQGSNPDLPSKFYPVNPNNRAFHIINSAMFVTATKASDPSSSFKYLAPFHATPYRAGIISTPPATFDDNGVETQVGGGAITSYAFNSQLETTSSNGEINVKQPAPFSLSDITGASSAAFAETVENKIDPHLNLGLDPLFSYFPVLNAQAPSGSLTKFSDGGTIENTGLCAALQYGDNDNFIVFLNSDQALAKDSSGNIIVGLDLPGLFGLNGYDKSSGTYPAYPDTDVPMSANTLATEYRFNKVFEINAFYDAIEGLWKAQANGGAAVYLQSNLEVLDNEWWGITGGRTVNVLWYWNTPASDFNDQLALTVLADMSSNFPNYDTFDTHLSVRAMNLLAHFTSWAVLDNKQLFEAMFDGSASSYEVQSEASIGGSGKPKQGSTIAIVSSFAALGVFAVIATIIIVVRRRRQVQGAELVE